MKINIKKQKIKILAWGLLIGALFVFPWNNGDLRTTLRAIVSGSYPAELKKIQNTEIEFNLTNMPASRLSFGIRYPKDVVLQEIKEFEVDSEIILKIFRNEKLTKVENITKTDKTWLDFKNTGFKVTEFYKFTWSPKKFKKDNVKISIDFNGKFSGYDIIVFDAGII